LGISQHSLTIIKRKNEFINPNILHKLTLTKHRKSTTIHVYQQFFSFSRIFSLFYSFICITYSQVVFADVSHTCHLILWVVNSCIYVLRTYCITIFRSATLWLPSFRFLIFLTPDVDLDPGDRWILLHYPVWNSN
jgi:hypothetical protein